ncbi:hypothetical protein LCGC14_0331690 [marine sediment metagenome]|uniref:Uncharacterized protein n=1 Tax=marine sediment metagenome TaxID=412755 RepID=A0A0F9TG11_9ZZZZ
MDLERLHENYLSKPARGGGRTYDMLVSVVQCADWPDVSPIMVVCAQWREVSRLMEMAVHIAHDLGFSNRVLACDRLQVETTEIIFRSSSERSMGQRFANDFKDHFVWDVDRRLMRLYPGVTGV